MRLDTVIAEFKPTAIMHFAAFASVGESAIAPGKYYRNNVAGSLTLMEAAREHGIDRFIFSSSCAVYGVTDRSPIIETVRPAPISPYGQSKLMTEHLLADFATAHKMRSVALRYFNAAGADPECEIGEDHDPETHLIPLLFDAALGRRGEITIFGLDHETPDGTCIRDYVHVSDLADAHVRALQSLDASPPQVNVYNLGNGQGFSVREVIDAAERIAGTRIPVINGKSRAGDPPILISDSARARAQLGWSPRFTDLDDILRTAWAWHQKRQAQYVRMQCQPKRQSVWLPPHDTSMNSVSIGSGIL